MDQTLPAINARTSHRCSTRSRSTFTGKIDKVTISLK